MQIDFLAKGMAAARDFKDVFDDVVDAQGVLIDDFQHAAIVYGYLVVFVEQFRGIGDRAQRVADFVRDTRGQVSQRRELGLLHAVANR